MVPDGAGRGLPIVVKGVRVPLGPGILKTGDGWKGGVMRIMLIAGARPNFMKVAPLIGEILRHSSHEPFLVHTGQHYDDRMSSLFFEELGMPRPNINLEVGSGSHAFQTGTIMIRFEPVLEKERPDLVLVVGDVNSTVACALTAVKMGVHVGHVEAGLRSFDRTMPEEINRMLTDTISDLLFVSEQSGIDNLRREGIPDRKIHLVGNVMIDSLEQHKLKAMGCGILDELGLRPNGYGVLTLHRPSNVDDPRTLANLVRGLAEAASLQPVIFPCHPRTRKRIEQAGLLGHFQVLEEGRSLEPAKITLLEPLGYLEFLRLMMEACFVVTDSGGIQEETTVLDVPCLTIRENTERPSTIEFGTNLLVASDMEMLIQSIRTIMDGKWKKSRRPPLWDGRASSRIVKIIEGLDAAEWRSHGERGGS